MNAFFLGALPAAVNTILYVILAIFVLLLMILIHETGHYLAGKLLKFKINEFSIGFGKAIFSKTNKAGEKFSIRIFPLGGYCAFEGETEALDNPQAFNNQKPWKRMIVLFAGAFFNFLSAIIFSFILLISFGYDIYQVKGNPEIYNENLKVYDVIYKVDGKDVNFATNGNLITLINNAEDKDNIVLTVKRYNQETGKNEMIDVSVALKPKFKEGVDASTLTEEEKADLTNRNIYAFDSNGNLQKTIGELSLYRRPFLEALGGAFSLAIFMAWAVLKSLWLLITFQIPINQIGGTITTISLIATYTQTSIVNLFILLPLISANLAMFNLLPFPALDGAQMVFTGVEWITKKPIKEKVKGIINTCGLIFLLAFVVIVDILHFVL
ncbi:MAG: site-2 protease family protein [Clostridia bacterium]|nr:site-2 protease family protein [Clostridia bacterium]